MNFINSYTFLLEIIIKRIHLLSLQYTEFLLNIFKENFAEKNHKNKNRIEIHSYACYTDCELMGMRRKKRTNMHNNNFKANHINLKRENGREKNHRDKDIQHTHTQVSVDIFHNDDDDGTGTYGLRVSNIALVDM